MVERCKKNKRRRQQLGQRQQQLRRQRQKRNNARMATTMNTTARLRYLRMSPRKVRLLIDLVRGMNASHALTELQFSKKVGAKPVAKLIQSAIANATHNHEMKEES